MFSLRDFALRTPAARLAGALALTLALAHAAPAGAQTAEEKANARSLATRGLDAFAANKFAESLDMFTRAEQILHAPTHVLMIARSQAALGQLVAARESYLKLTREELPASAAPAFKRAQQDGKTELAALEPRIAELRVQLEGVAGREVPVKLDEQAVPPALVGVHRPIDPGTHEVAAYPPGLAPVKSTVVLKDGEKKDVTLVIPPPPAATGPVAAREEGHDRGPRFFTPLRAAGLGLGVVGAAGVGIGIGFLVKGFGEAGDADALFDACPRPCPAAQRKAITDLDDQAASSKSIGVGVLAGGAAVLTTGVVLMVIGKPKGRAGAARVEPWFSGTGAGLRGEF